MTAALPSRTLALAAATLLLGGLVTGCQNGARNDSAGSTVDTSQLISSLPPAKGEVAKITWNVGSEPDTLDPRNAVNYGSGQIVRNMCEALLKMDADFNISENLASSYQQVSPTELKLTIRDGVKFWDGKPLTAEDVVFSLNRAKAEDSTVNSGFVAVKDIAATGPMEVTVTFNEPDETFVKTLATLAGVVVEKAWAEQAGDQVGTATGGLMCTGPYTFTNWRAGSGITITRNDAYWNADLKPKAKQVDFTFVADDTALAQALDAGEIDGSYELPVSTLNKLTGSKTGKVVFGPSTQSASLYVARPDGPLQDLKLRDALQRVIDRDALTKVVFNGSADPNYTHLTPETWPTAERSIYQPDYDKWAAARSFDLEAAKKLLAESSYNGAPLQLAILAGDQVSGRVAQLFQQQAKAIGVNVEIQSMQPLVFDQAGYDATKRQGVDLMYTTNFNTLQNPIEPLSFDLLPGQPYNYTNFDNADVTRLLSQARAATDPKQSAQYVVQAQDIFEPSSSVIPLVANHEASFINNKLTGAPTSFAYWSMPQMAYIGAAQ
ncbi:ABC transporter substrate-binding protein [Mycolicibacterium sp. 018/SC-01/001]|uniref:ABC transporter substrate-binding protein n=1 Tax=Mycolicibacterium sp. 018/SC-01/001 TaxID=2592069 RepID=UPI00117CDE4C|nr:ABC transporter substrate-binding protein [Mycolicibacterium sp. 018/SC-01/001]TRW80975.1 ABC transporter substrate-binding protein [Mycolicibacterium sp. 018/SC-01/001]